jgi:hypothetical protein
MLFRGQTAEFALPGPVAEMFESVDRLRWQYIRRMLARDWRTLIAGMGMYLADQTARLKSWLFVIINTTIFQLSGLKSEPFCLAKKYPLALAHPVWPSRRP